MPLLQGNALHHNQNSQQPLSPCAEHEQEQLDSSRPHQEHPAYSEVQLRRGSQSQLSDLAKSALFSSMSIHAKPHNTMPIVAASAPHPAANLDGTMDDQLKVIGQAPSSLAAPGRPSSIRHRHTDERVGFAEDVKDEAKPRPTASGDVLVVGSPTAMNDTPATTAPSSPSM